MDTLSHDYIAALIGALPADIRENIRHGQWWLGDDYMRRLEAHGLAASHFDGQGTHTWITDLARSVAVALTEKPNDCVWYWEGGTEVGRWRRADAGTRAAIRRGGRVAHDGNVEDGPPIAPPSADEFNRLSV